MKEIIHLETEKLRQLQLIELEMLVEVDRICRKNSICYSLDAGTLLGAVRHKGFIPWDDDLDIMFLHKDYERFFEACKTELDTERFFFQDHRTDEGYRWGYGKIRRLNTEYIKNGQEHLKQKTGICIDVFDVENLPDERGQRKRFLLYMFCIRKTLYSALGKRAADKQLLKLWYCFLNLIPLDYVFMLKGYLTKKYDDIETERVQCHMWPLKQYPEGYPRRLFSSFCDLEFEGFQFMAIENYHEYLGHRYGNYMELPPEEQRTGVMEAVKYSLIDITYEQIKKEYEEGRTTSEWMST